MANSSEHKKLEVQHRGHTISVSYWCDYDDEKKIVDWSVKDEKQSGYNKTVTHGDYVREPFGGRRSILGFGGRPEKSFHELIAEAIETAAEWINQNRETRELPDVDEIGETLELRGYRLKSKEYE